MILLVCTTASGRIGPKTVVVFFRWQPTFSSPLGGTGRFNRNVQSLDSVYSGWIPCFLRSHTLPPRCVQDAVFVQGRRKSTWYIFKGSFIFIVRSHKSSTPLSRVKAWLRLSPAFTVFRWKYLTQWNTKHRFKACCPKISSCSKSSHFSLQYRQLGCFTHACTGSWWLYQAVCGNQLSQITYQCHITPHHLRKNPVQWDLFMQLLTSTLPCTV